MSDSKDEIIYNLQVENAKLKIRIAHNRRQIKQLQAENKTLKFDNENLKNEDLRLLRRIEQLIIEKHELQDENEELKTWQQYEKWATTDAENERLKKEIKKAMQQIDLCCGRTARSILGQALKQSHNQSNSKTPCDTKES